MLHLVQSIANHVSMGYGIIDKITEALKVQYPKVLGHFVRVILERFENPFQHFTKTFLALIEKGDIEDIRSLIIEGLRSEFKKLPQATFDSYMERLERKIPQYPDLGHDCRQIYLHWLKVQPQKEILDRIFPIISSENDFQDIINLIEDETGKQIHRVNRIKDLFVIYYALYGKTNQNLENTKFLSSLS